MIFGIDCLLFYEFDHWLWNGYFRNNILMLLFLPGEVGIGLCIKDSRDVLRLVMGNADVIVKIAEAVVSFLTNASILLAQKRFIFVDDLLNHLENIRIVLHIHLFRLNYRFHQQVLLGLYFLVIFLESFESFLTNRRLMSLSDMLLDVLILFAELVLSSTDHTEDGTFHHFDLTQLQSFTIVHYFLLWRQPANDGSWLHQILRVQIRLPEWQHYLLWVLRVDQGLGEWGISGCRTEINDPWLKRSIYRKCLLWGKSCKWGVLGRRCGGEERLWAGR